jgi:hypothetical protein
MKFLKILLIVFVIVLIAIQFLPTQTNLKKGLSSNDITKTLVVPANVQLILRTSCYDCHSNNTHYPWYSNIQPVRYMLDSHISDGKKELNFNEFSSYSTRKQKNKLKAIAKEVAEDGMPLFSYTIIHQYAKLDTTQKLVVKNWIAQMQDSLSHRIN